MLKELRIKIANKIAPDYIKDIKGQNQKDIDLIVSQRVAEIMSKMNVLDVLLKDFHGTFSQEYERPEEKLNSQGQLQMMMWGYTQSKDPNFKYLTDWIMDTFANDMLRHAAVTPERILYGRAQIASTELMKKEVGRLSNLYEELLEKNKLQDFDSTKAVE